MRIFAISDLHTDFRDNWLWLKQLSNVDYREDALIVAGDIADRTEIIRDTLQLLRSRFRHIFYTPGNHELWVRFDDFDSIEKLKRILAMCDGLGVHTTPVKLEQVWIVPLFSWYDPDFDDEEHEEEESELEGWADFYFCRWPEGIGPLHQFFLNMNTIHLRTYDAPVISFSHFLPRRDLLPAREHLKFKGLPRVAGCQALDLQIRAMPSIAHVFGHSHINLDRVIDGINYVQNAIRTPNERDGSPPPIKLIWDTTQPSVQKTLPEAAPDSLSASPEL
jgi:hypothetical protein